MAEEAGRKEGAHAEDISAELARREDRLAAIRTAKAHIEARELRGEGGGVAGHAEQATGKKLRGKEPRPPAPGLGRGIR